MRHLLLTVALALTTAPARADDVARDRRELARDRRALADDRHDLARLERLQAALGAALARHDLRAVAAVDDGVRRELEAERRETRGELARDRAEVGRDRSEHDRWALRDDRRDLRVEGATADRRAQIGAEYTGLRGRYGPGELERRRVLLGELVQLARGEVREDGRELREDRRDLRDDRRERGDGPRPPPPRDGDDRPRY